MLSSRLKDQKEKIAVVGLGYVGMPIAVAFSKKYKVVGYDINKKKVDIYRKGKDPTCEIGDDVIKDCTVEFTSNEKKLMECKFFVIAVPTPVKHDKTPDLFPVIESSKIVGRNLSKGSIVVYESTVYPGVTENICKNILEKESKLICGKDFKIGYSPERINPGDKEHKLETIKKIVSGMDEDSLNEISNVYESIIEAGIHKVSSIKVAEAAKIVENSQRDINIAFMNELAMVFDKMEIDTNEVVEAMNTKWNALGFRPGLVGGHCIGVDPYYFIYEAENLGYHSQIIASGRKVNDGMGKFIADTIIKKMIINKKNMVEAKIVIMGLTFKENCPDIRNSKVVDIVRRLEEYGVKPIIVDPWVNKEDALKEYDINIAELKEIHDVDVLVFAVSHEQFKRMKWEEIDNLYKKMPAEKKILIDIKGIFALKDLKETKYLFWRL